MSNEHWIKSKEREAFDELNNYISEYLQYDHYDAFVKLLATYRKRAFDAGVFAQQKKLDNK